MTDKKFNAVLAKNALARHFKRETNPIWHDWLFERLKEIELYIGTANQPDVQSIITSKMDI